jgi:hypothetical protein
MHAQSVSERLAQGDVVQPPLILRQVQHRTRWRGVPVLRFRGSGPCRSTATPKRPLALRMPPLSAFRKHTPKRGPALATNHPPSTGRHRPPCSPRRDFRSWAGRSGLHWPARGTDTPDDVLGHVTRNCSSIRDHRSRWLSPTPTLPRLIADPCWRVIKDCPGSARPHFGSDDPRRLCGTWPEDEDRTRMAGDDVLGQSSCGADVGLADGG